MGNKIIKYCIFLMKSIYHYIDLITDISLIVLFFKEYKESNVTDLKR